MKAVRNIVVIGRISKDLFDLPASVSTWILPIETRYDVLGIPGIDELHNGGEASQMGYGPNIITYERCAFSLIYLGKEDGLKNSIFNLVYGGLGSIAKTKSGQKVAITLVQPDMWTNPKELCEHVLWALRSRESDSIGKDGFIETLYLIVPEKRKELLSTALHELEAAILN